MKRELSSKHYSPHRSTVEYAWKEVDKLPYMRDPRPTIVHIQQEMVELLRITKDKDLVDDIMMLLYATTMFAWRLNNA